MTTLHPKCAPTNELDQWADLIGDVPAVMDDLLPKHWRALLACLSEEAQDIVVCYRIHGESFESIGLRYGYTKEWARLRYNRAEDALRRRTKDGGQRRWFRLGDPDALALEHYLNYLQQRGAKASMNALERRRWASRSEHIDWSWQPERHLNSAAHARRRRRLAKVLAKAYPFRSGAEYDHPTKLSVIEPEHEDLPLAA